MTTPKPCTMPEINPQKYRERYENFCIAENAYQEYLDKIEKADLVEKIDGHGIDTTTEKS